MIKNRPKALASLSELPKRIEEHSPLVAQDFLGGLITDLNPAEIPLNSLQNLVNGFYINGSLFKRNGLTSFGATAPNGNKILAVYIFFDVASGVNLYRITKNSIHRLVSGSWVVQTGVALTGTDYNYFSFTVADGRGFFSNQGVQAVQEFKPLTNSYVPLGNAPQYKYLVSAFNRVIGLNRVGVPNIPYEVGWSGDLNFGEWNPLVDISAGSNPLVDSPSDLNDDITGGFNLTNVICITRQRSIWLAQNQPSATNPFFFFCDVPRIGCDCPQTIQIRDKGIVFYNYEKSSAYYYTPGSQPEDLSSPIKRWLKSCVLNINNLYASYDGSLSVYSIYYRDELSNAVQCWSYNFEYKNWSYQTYSGITFVGHSEYSQSYLTINDLVGTINALGGATNDLSIVNNSAATFFGKSDGTLFTQPTIFNFLGTAAGVNTANILPSDNGTAINTVYDSKVIEYPLENTYTNRCVLELIPFFSAAETLTCTLQYSKDKGKTFTNYKVVTFTNTSSGKSQIIKGTKNINSRSFMWRLTTSGAMFALTKFEVEYTNDINNSNTISRR